MLNGLFAYFSVFCLHQMFSAEAATFIGPSAQFCVATGQKACRNLNKLYKRKTLYSSEFVIVQMSEVCNHGKNFHEGISASQGNVVELGNARVTDADEAVPEPVSKISLSNLAVW